MKFSGILTLILGLFQLTLVAQSEKDSLLKASHSTSLSDSLRFDALRKLMVSYPDSATRYLGWMEKLAQESKDPMIRVKAGKEKAGLLQKSGDPAQAEQVLKDQLAAALGQPALRARIYARSYLAELFTQTGKLDEAKGLYEQAITDAKSGRNEVDLVYVLMSAGALYLNQGDFSKSLDFFFESLRILENYQGVYPKKDQQLAQANCNAAIIYAQMDEFPKARSYFEKALFWAEKSGNQEMAANITGNIAYLLYLEGDFERSLEYGFRAVEMHKKLGSEDDLGSTLSNIGAVYEKKGDGVQALRYYGQSLAIFEKLGYASGIQRLLMSIGSHHQARGNLKEAVAYTERAYELARESGYLENEKELAKRLYEIYEAQGQYQKALKMHVQYMTLRDSVNGDEAKQALIRYEFQEKALKDSISFVQKQAATELGAVQKENQRNASLIGLTLVALFAGLLFVQGRRRRKTNELLSAQKTEIQAKSNQNELLLKEIHHRVKNNLQTISSLLHLQSAHITDADVKQAVVAGQHRVESMALIHQKLYQRDNLAAIEMKDYLSNLVQSLIDTFDADPERIRFDLNMPELELDVDTAVPLGLIVNELITNSLKYAFPDGRSGTITVSLQKADNQLQLLVADDGVGKANTATGTSFGSQLVTLLTAQVGGKITQDVSNGYITRIVLPQNLD